MIKSLGKQYIFVPVTAIPLFKQNTLYVEYNTTFRIQLLSVGVMINFI